MRYRIVFTGLLLHLAVLFSAIAPVSAQEEPPAPPEGAALWHDADASYRLELRQKGGSGAAFVDNRRLALPAGFENGILVTDKDGVPVEQVKWYADGGVVIPASEADRALFLYFGYESDKKKNNASVKQDMQENARLTLYQASPKLTLLPENWRENETRKCYDTIRNQAWNINRNLYKPCDEKKNCTYLRNTFRRCKRSLLPCCGRNQFIRSFQAKTNLLANLHPMNAYCCRLVSYHPDYAYQLQSHAPCHFYRDQYNLRRFHYVKKENLERIKTVAVTDPANGLEGMLFEAFQEHSRMNRRKQRLESGLVFLPKRPFDTGDRFTILFRGNLLIREEGDYEFQIISNSTRILHVDGKRVLRTFGTQTGEENRGSKESLTLHLTAGLHKFELIYHKEKVTTWISAAWRKKGVGEFQTLNEDDFSPELPAVLSALHAKDGRSFPLIRRQDRFAVYTGKQEKYFLNVFQPASPELRLDQWNVEGQDYPGFMNVIATKAGETASVTVVPASDEFDTLTALLPGRKTDPVPVRPDVDLKFWTPALMYDDEVLDYQVELDSRMPLRLPVLLRTNQESAVHAINRRESEFVILEPLQEEYVERFASDHILKFSGTFNGPEFQGKSMIQERSVEIPGLVFAREKIVLRPLKEIGDFTCSGTRLYEEKGETLLIPLLHRPTLHELRAWELPKALATELRQIRKVIVIAEDFGNFRAQLETALAKRKIKLEFLSWRSNDPDSAGADSLRSLPELLAAIRKTDADLALVIPMMQSRRTALSIRDESRVIAFLMESLRTFSPVFGIRLLPALPSRPDLNLRPQEQELTAQLREFKRQYGIDFVETDDFFRTLPELRESTYRTADGVPVETPDQLVPQIVDFLMKMELF